MSNISGVNSNTPTAAAASSGTNSNDSTSALGNTQTFLTLLVAQMKNQDPTQPVDGTQFVTQLAQFSNLEQSVAMRTDIDAIKSKYVGTDATASSSSGTSAA